MLPEEAHGEDVAEARQHAVDKGRSLRLVLIGFMLLFLVLCIGAVALLWVLGFIEDVSHEFVVLFFITVLFTLLLSLLYFYLRMEIRATEASLLAKMEEVEDLLDQKGLRHQNRGGGLLGRFGGDLGAKDKERNRDYSTSTRTRGAAFDTTGDHDPYGTRDFTTSASGMASGMLANATDWAGRGAHGARSMFDSAKDALSHSARGQSDAAFSQAAQGALGAWDMADQGRQYASEQANSFAQGMGDYTDKQMRKAEKEAKREARKGARHALESFW